MRRGRGEKGEEGRRGEQGGGEIRVVRERESWDRQVGIYKLKYVNAFLGAKHPSIYSFCLPSVFLVSCFGLMDPIRIFCRFEKIIYLRPIVSY